MPTRPSYAAYVELEDAAGAIVYTGEAIYRPAKSHPTTGVASPTIGIPDDAMEMRPSGLAQYRVWLSGEPILTSAVYLERVSTCWWFVLERAPAHPPTV